MNTSKERNHFSIRGAGYEKFFYECKSFLAAKIFFFLVQSTKLGNNNCVFVKQQAIADQFGITRQALRKPFIELIRLNAVKKIKHGYMINPDVEIKEYTKFHKTVYARWLRE